MVGASASLDQGVEVKLVDDQAGSVTDVVVGADLAALFAYSRAWAADVKPEDVDLSFSSMLAAMVGDEQPLCRWLVGFFDRLGVRRSDITKDRVYRHPSSRRVRRDCRNSSPPTPFGRRGRRPWRCET